MSSGDEYLTMPNHYLDFLDQRAAQRRLMAKFAQPLPLIVHTLLFIAVMTGIWLYGSLGNAHLWRYAVNFPLPVLGGLLWSCVLAVHALIHYRRSAAVARRRELAVEDEMRQFIERNADPVDDAELFAMHRALSSDLERAGRWSLGLALFAVINVLNWIISALNMGTSWGFQLTLPAAILLVGGSYTYQMWQQSRREERDTWFTRLPLSHMLLYGVGTVVLGLLGAFRMVNYWDVNTLVGGWTAALLFHIVVAVLLLPALRHLLPNVFGDPHIKRKPAERLLLANDGEIVELTQQDAPAYHVKAR